MDLAANCSKCKCAMEEGYMVEWHGKFALSEKWYPGIPVESQFVGLKTGMFDLDLKQARPTTTYRCTSCGYLESYCK